MLQQFHRSIIPHPPYKKHNRSHTLSMAPVVFSQHTEIHAVFNAVLKHHHCNLPIPALYLLFHLDLASSSSGLQHCLIGINLCGRNLDHSFGINALKRFHSNLVFVELLRLDRDPL